MMKHDPDKIFATREGASIPLMVGAGETVVVCGVWQTGTVWSYTNIVGAAGRVVFIEANPDTVQMHRAFTNGKPWVSWVNKAVWSGPKEIQFVRSLGDRHSWDRVLDDQAKGHFPYDKVPRHDQTTIEADTIDNILASLGIEKIDHLNLTVNRCEFEALEGAKGIIDASPDMRLRLPSRRGEIMRMRKVLKEMGFTAYVSEHPPEWREKKGGKRYRVYAVKGNASE